MRSSWRAVNTDFLLIFHYDANTALRRQLFTNFQVVCALCSCSTDNLVINNLCRKFLASFSIRIEHKWFGRFLWNWHLQLFGRDLSYDLLLSSAWTKLSPNRNAPFCACKNFRKIHRPAPHAFAPVAHTTYTCVYTQINISLHYNCFALQPFRRYIVYIVSTLSHTMGVRLESMEKVIRTWQNRIK